MPMINSELFKDQLDRAINARREYNAACDRARAKAEVKDRDPEGFVRAEEVMYEKSRLATNAEMTLAHAVIKEVTRYRQETEAPATA